MNGIVTALDQSRSGPRREHLIDEKAHLSRRDEARALLGEAARHIGCRVVDSDLLVDGLPVRSRKIDGAGDDVPGDAVEAARTLLTIMWRTENETSEWAASMSQVPAMYPGIVVGITAVMGNLPWVSVSRAVLRGYTGQPIEGSIISEVIQK